jgi:hypothetical protein
MFDLARPIREQQERMLTRSEAQAAVHAALEVRSRLDPIKRKDLFIFAIEMSRILEFPGDDDPASDIEAWAEAWLNTQQRPTRRAVERWRPVALIGSAARTTIE